MRPRLGLWCGLMTASWVAVACGDQTYHSVAGGNFVQDWSNGCLITINDDWSGVLSIMGYRGDDLTTVVGADPQTILAPGTVTPIDIIANQSNPALTTGGIAEFDGIANPTVALQGSGTADAPFLLLHLDCSGVSNVVVSYELRDIDGSADNAVTRVALQYRVGEGGNFINLPAGFVADATTGQNQATLVTPVQVLLPDQVNGQTQVQVRIITANALGSDEWVGVNDIRVSTTPVIRSLARTGSEQYELTCMTRSGGGYQTEGSTNLCDWTSAGLPVVGDGTVKPFDLQTNAPVCYWRVRMTY